MCLNEKSGHSSEKADIGNEKSGHSSENADIENEKSGHSHKKLDMDNEKIKKFSNKTLRYIDELFAIFGYENVFGRMLVEETLKLKKKWCFCTYHKAFKGRYYRTSCRAWKRQV